MISDQEAGKGNAPLQIGHPRQTNESEGTGAKFTPPPILFKRMIRRPELRKIVPLADTTIYEMEQRGAFPRRFFLTPRCVVWDLAEIEAWVNEKRRESETETIQRPRPDVRKRKARPVRKSRPPE
ncbi:AlpA family transcriptional regulator [Phyllobacterium phragmitis]|uniref:AlpA family transcriptional regulator n=1 Tax=Phyllobacterium phragmitis TaxID=2670329 RepID=A0A2S9IRM6_9HYPH|nr:AlpA family phage regulatory protein [Phyllobacterium phragmitis]PRD43184.1 AlpA family transcriptional regulator [Phyllobacterium phragmitis]